MAHRKTTERIDVRFIRPMVLESRAGLTSCPKRSFVRREVARIAFVMVRSAWGTTRIPRAAGIFSIEGRMNAGGGRSAKPGNPGCVYPPQTLPR
jgi:hypothetical protein